MLVTMPFVLLLLDYWPLNRFHLRKRCARPGFCSGCGCFEKIPLLVLAAGIVRGDGPIPRKSMGQTLDQAVLRAAAGKMPWYPTSPTFGR